MAATKNYRDLIVWQKSMDLVLEIYRITRFLPNDELYGLCSPMRRAAVSIPSNIAEGQQRISEKEFVRFLSIARGSNAEIETQLEICIRLGYLVKPSVINAEQLCSEIGKMLNSLVTKYA